MLGIDLRRRLNLFLVDSNIPKNKHGPFSPQHAKSSLDWVLVKSQFQIRQVRVIVRCLEFSELLCGFDFCNYPFPRLQLINYSQSENDRSYREVN